MSLYIVTTTFPDEQAAAAVATCLVEARLAACVQLAPGIRSFYRWGGRLESAREALMTIKTSGERVEALVARLQALHPYELPEIVAVEATVGSPAYFAWVAAETREVP
ncbi:divalent-cation tolerance protein CutA [Xanthomonas massiliensis]|jgi:periplasmic divalent cation tolerance protein|uniref:divalent-cation tolerance protein CutA n=1 Tax=Xanthomonas massiliensis TaxID=1720302 RepID=UPI000826FE8D|nr:divalent-cation tolerance protein CutA [Xanthomonas massiliensis]